MISSSLLAPVQTSSLRHFPDLSAGGGAAPAGGAPAAGDAPAAEAAKEEEEEEEEESEDMGFDLFG